MDGIASFTQEFKKLLASVSSSQSANAQADFTLIDATSGNVSLTLAPHSQMFLGNRSYLCGFKRIDSSSNTVTLTPSSGLVDGAASKTLQSMESCRIISDGTNYYIMRTNIGPLNLALAAGTNTTTATLIAGASVDVTIPITPTLADNNYQCVPALTNQPTVALLGSLSVTVKTKNAGSVVVTLKNSGLLTLSVGQTIEVICLKSS